VGEFSWLDWTWHPDALLVELFLVAIYLLGIGPLRRRFQWSGIVEHRFLIRFAAGIAVLVIAEHSPLHALSETYFFSAHMVQHLLIILIVPPLLLLGTPPWLMRPLLRIRYIESVVRLFTRPVIAFCAFNLTLILWHFPEFYDLALRSHNVHLLEHGMLMGTALIAWWPILSLVREIPRLSYPLQMLYLFLQTLPMGFLGAILVFSTVSIYETYSYSSTLWGMEPLLDQQIGGLLMKVGGGFGFLGVLGVVFFRWFTAEEVSPDPVSIEREIQYDS
jgi:putative membrane protein